MLTCNYYLYLALSGCSFFLSQGADKGTLMLHVLGFSSLGEEMPQN